MRRRLCSEPVPEPRVPATGLRPVTAAHHVTEPLPDWNPIPPRQAQLRACIYLLCNLLYFTAGQFCGGRYTWSDPALQEGRQVGSMPP